MKKSTLLLPVFAGLAALSGCAAIMKGSKSTVSLQVPPQTEFHNYSGYSADAATVNGRQVLEVTSGQEYVVEYQHGTYRDSMLLERKLLWGYVIADLWFTSGFGLPFDLAGPGYTVDKDVIAFPPPPDSLCDTAAIPRLNLYAFDGRKAYVREPLGIVAIAHLGMKMPYNQVPLFGNSYGLGLGYRVMDPLVVMGYYGGNGLMDYAPKGSQLYMEVGVTTFALESRYHVSRDFYATGGLEYMFIATDSMSVMTEPRWRKIRGFSDHMFGASVGGGMAFPGFFLEARQHWGVAKLDIRDEVRQPVSNFEVRFGLNVEF
jgi:hypothetical protein